MRIAFDIKRMQPGCVLLQAALGGSVELANKFPSETWLIAPTDDLKVYEITPEQATQLIARVEAYHSGR